MILSTMHIIMGFLNVNANCISSLQFGESTYFFVIKHITFLELLIPFSGNSKTKKKEKAINIQFNFKENES